MNDNDVTILAQALYRHQRKPFGIRRADRRLPVYAIGATGSGKTSLMRTMLMQDMMAGECVILLDPHGDICSDLLAVARAHRPNDLIYLDPADSSCPWSFNPLATTTGTHSSYLASWLVDAFQKTWDSSWGPRLEHCLRYAVMTLQGWPGATLADIPLLFTDGSFRRMVFTGQSDPQVIRFWQEFEGYSKNAKSDMVSALANKTGAFLADHHLRGLLTEQRTPLIIEQVIEEGKVLLVNLSKGRLPADSGKLLGALLLARITLTGLQRTSIPEHERRDCYVYLDEVQNFASPGLASMLSELRKYRICLTMANQSLTQFALPVRDAILGNLGTLACFRVGVQDARLLEPSFWPDLRTNDLISQPNHHAYVKLMVNGAVTSPFSAQTLPPETFQA